MEKLQEQFDKYSLKLIATNTCAYINIYTIYIYIYNIYIYICIYIYIYIHYGKVGNPEKIVRNTISHLYHRRNTFRHLLGNMYCSFGVVLLPPRLDLNLDQVSVEKKVTFSSCSDFFSPFFASWISTVLWPLKNLN